MTDMYQSNRSVTRRILWYALWFVVAVAVVWLLVWLLFFREPEEKKVNKTGTSSSATSRPQVSSKPPKTTPPATSATPATPPKTDTQSSSPQPAASTPDKLADTGPGDVLVPVVGAAILGMLLHSMRLRRHLLKS